MTSWVSSWGDPPDEDPRYEEALKRAEDTSRCLQCGSLHHGDLDCDVGPRPGGFMRKQAE